MKRLQDSAAAKVIAAVVLLCAAFAACVFGVRAVLSVQSVFEDNWQNSVRCSTAREKRREELINGIEIAKALLDLERQIEAGKADATIQADAEALRESRTTMEELFARENTWFRFRLMTEEDGRVLGTNLNEGESMIKAVSNVYRFAFELTEDELGAGFGSCDGGYEHPTQGEVQPDGGSAGPGESQPVKLVLEYGVPEEVRASVKDEFYWAWRAWETDRSNFDQYLTGFLNLSALTLVALIWILWTAGHSSKKEGIVLTWQDKIFLDVYAVAMVTAGVFLIFAGVWAVETTYWHANQQFYWAERGNYGLETYEPLGILGAAACFTGVAAAGSLLLRTFAVRIKAGCLTRTTLLCRVWGWTVRTVHEFLRSLPITWKAVAGFGGYVIVSLWLFDLGRYEGFLMLLYFCLQIVLMLILGWWALNYHRLRQGTKTIAKGDLEYQINTRHMPYDLRLQAEDLNNISVGLSTAVDERIKSERFKAELITNVSHDLKTPLTSIINYVNLLKNTEQTDPKAVEYIEVLDRKSQRLKKLTEDLVEASKASTGVLSVTREKIGMSQLIDQALGEWEEKLNDRKLTLVTTLPEGETWVYADGRHLWRVIDNLLSNCSKYAMEGTRVYLDLERGKGQVSLSVKNISREPLNVPAERLMERFVRGEESRSTEGSGLGLSIARSLTELQGGAFELAVDGDLFKAIVTLPQAN